MNKYKLYDYVSIFLKYMTFILISIGICSHFLTGKTTPSWIIPIAIIFTLIVILKSILKIIIDRDIDSLANITAILEHQFNKEANQGPTFAIVEDKNKKRELVLFTNRSIECQTANNYLREWGISKRRKFYKVIKIDSIPVLDTGKINYVALKEML